MPVHRIEVRPNPAVNDPRAAAVLREAAAAGLGSVPSRIDVASVYLIDAELSAQELRSIADELLADPIAETAVIGSAPAARAASVIEVHPLPGVMDPNAESIELAIRAMLNRDVAVRTGMRYDAHGCTLDDARALAQRSLANTVIHAIHTEPYHPASFPAGSPYTLTINRVPLTTLTDDELAQLSRNAHLFLSLDEMKAIQAYYREQGVEPREIELETLAQTWSEHCVHKTLKATVRYTDTASDRSAALPIASLADRPGHALNADGSVTITNLLKSTIAAATHELIADGIDWCLSVFVDNAGVIAFDDHHAVCFKCETHNHPSAIEPYGGAATGIGGCIRDIIGTGLAAKPIAATDVFCVAFPDRWVRAGEGLITEITEGTEKGKEKGKEKEKRGKSGGAESFAKSSSPSSSSPSSLNPSSSSLPLSVPSVISVVNPSEATQLPQGCLHPRRILQQVVAGVRDYGNRMGIPTVNGAVWFHDDYIGNPLVFCGCIGIMPIDKIRGQVEPGDRIIALGGRTGRDGIHGATFSSAELTDTHADEFSHAVQIGNAITEKKLLDAILEARDNPESLGGTLYNAITDCGAGGFSSAVGEMARELGALVELEQAPLKYQGLSPTEIWISEAQERMVLAVPARNLARLRAICEKHEVELADLGRFGTDTQELILTYHGTEVGRLSMHFLHEGIPNLTREAAWSSPASGSSSAPAAIKSPADHNEMLLKLLAHPNIASKHWIIRQYDHEVQGATVIKPLIGPRSLGPSDAAVLAPVADSMRGLAIANGLATGYREDPYLMALAAVDECVRNLVCVGADPDRIAILDNFSWPSCNDPQSLASLVRACEACYDAAKAYRTPFISGKDSLNNQFTTESGVTIRIPHTLLISGMAIVSDIRRCVTMDAKTPGNLLLLLGPPPHDAGLRGSHYAALTNDQRGALPVTDLTLGPAAARTMHALIASGLVHSAHDVSDGGLLVAAAEMAFAGNLGLRLHLNHLPPHSPASLLTNAYSEAPSRYLFEIHPSALERVRGIIDPSIPCNVVGEFSDKQSFTVHDLNINLSLTTLREAWLQPLDW